MRTCQQGNEGSPTGGDLKHNYRCQKKKSQSSEGKAGIWQRFHLPTLLKEQKRHIVQLVYMNSMLPK